MDSLRYVLRGRSWYDMRDLAQATKAFRFVRSPGGHAGLEGNRLELAFGFSGADDLALISKQLGVPLDPEPFQGPGRVDVAGVSIFVWVGRGQVELHLSGADDPWEVTLADAERARLVEDALLGALGHLVIDPPQAGPLCVAPATWPEFFEEE